MSDASAPVQILLLEPNFVLRRTIVAVANQLGVASIQESVNVEAASSWLLCKRFDGVVINIDAGAAALDLFVRLRHGAFASESDLCAVALTSEAGDAPESLTRPYALLQLIRKPFKIAELLAAMQRMARLPA